MIKNSIKNSRIRKPPLWGGLAGLLLFFFGACKHEPRAPHIYEQNPEYTYMGVSFFGQFYSNIPYYVFSFTFLSDGMLNEDSTQIVAPGQHLFIEDFFVPQDRLDFLHDVEEDFELTEKVLFEMLQGEYQVSGKIDSDGFGGAFTFAPGEYLEIDNAKFILGARIVYFERSPSLFKRKLITDGTFTVSADGVVFNFKTEDGLDLGGKYQSSQKQSEKKITVKYVSEREPEREQ